MVDYRAKSTCICGEEEEKEEKDVHSLYAFISMSGGR